tara:strand:+ start:168 stop:554 length:387 start_codon:yes stop_codon:yes gene_type:complete
MLDSFKTSIVSSAGFLVRVIQLEAIQFDQDNAAPNDAMGTAAWEAGFAAYSGAATWLDDYSSDIFRTIAISDTRWSTDFRAWLKAKQKIAVASLTIAHLDSDPEAIAGTQAAIGAYAVILRKLDVLIG